MSEINYEISASMQNRLTVHRENRLKSNDVVSETSSREQLDSVEITVVKNLYSTSMVRI